mmetsp:Transcript_23943/g.66479  ORF Transcript_23943/g.66479 Transcript_23943/m.66479 type:complete len:470 (+) Transcript_23943:176-1585(+)
MPVPPESSSRRKPTARTALAVGLGVGLGAALLAAAIKLIKADRKRRAPLQSDLWNSSLDSDGKLVGWQQLLEKIRMRGVEPRLKPSAWPFLLGLYSVSGTAADRALQYKHLADMYSELLRQCEKLDSNLRETGGADRAMLPSEMEPPDDESARASSSRSTIMQFEEAQRIIVLDVVRTEMGPLFRMEESVRSPDGAFDDQGADPGSSDRDDSPYVWSGQLAREAAANWKLSGSPENVARAKRIGRRLVSILSAYAVHDPEVGYCQGMSDLAAPFVVVLQDDVEAFWCFECFMRTVRRNFCTSGEGMRGQLKALAFALQQRDPVLMHKLRQVGAAECLFAYRMALVCMRRELSLSNCLLLWEMLWADELQQSCVASEAKRSAGQRAHSSNGDLSGNIGHSPGGDRSAVVPDLFTCFMVDVIRCQRRPILDGSQSADDVMRVFSSYHISLWSSMREARRLRASISNRLREA